MGCGSSSARPSSATNATAGRLFIRSAVMPWKCGKDSADCSIIIPVREFQSFEGFLIVNIRTLMRALESAWRLLLSRAGVSCVPLLPSAKNEPPPASAPQPPAPKKERSKVYEAEAVAAPSSGEAAKAAPVEKKPEQSSQAAAPAASAEQGGESRQEYKPAAGSGTNPGRPNSAPLPAPTATSMARPASATQQRPGSARPPRPGSATPNIQTA
ncbi:hypothetical protein PLESTB_000666500 [Pleodorina starrii]|uniref:Uncharacterized protein n=1 Tax=Pleodorina starrii TaxID=330485 RepID=A0A9W6BIG6_9CHLO|nr:hypothetical protein PLESTB_000666500 [Pleodorina starrii]